jgi:toxoflavin synthase
MNPDRVDKQIYDSIGGNFDKTYELPANKILVPFLEHHLRRLGPWQGAAVLDLACGTGMGLRGASALGATNLIGIDISDDMVAAARKSLSSLSTTLELYLADCTKPLHHLGLQEKNFDLILALWLFGYAGSRAQLTEIWRNIATFVTAGGRVVGMLQEDSLPPSGVQGDLRSHGMRLTRLGPLQSGDGVRLRCEFNTDPKIEFEVTAWQRSTVENVARQCGIVEMQFFSPCQEVKDIVTGKDTEWWKELTAGCVLFTASKRGDLSN